MRVLVCGDRNYTDRAKVYATLDALDRLNGIETVIDGTATGADTFGYEWAVENDVQTQRFRPHWRHDQKCEPGCERPVGKVAGVLRNGQMLEEGRPDLVLAFHDHFADSKGTRDMVRRALRAGVRTRLYEGAFVMHPEGLRKLLRMRDG